jgi:Sec-independent protein translocase protein TatA
MFNLDPAKLLIIAVVAVILLGPDKLPQFARQVGGAWRSLNDFRHRMEADVRGHIPDLPSGAEIAHLARSPTALLNKLSTLGDADAAAEGTDHENGSLPGSAGAAGANGRDGTNDTNDGHLPDGAPIQPFGPGTVPLAPSSSHPSDVAVAGDPSLN